MTGEEFVSGLEKVKAHGDRKWTACCPAHDDKHPSLSVNETEDGRILVHCHAGCTADEIVDVMGLTVRDLFDGDGFDPIVATYDYQDEDGDLLYQVVRLDPKDFRVRRRAEDDDAETVVKDGWVWSLKYADGEPVQRVLYRLPEVLEAKGDQCVIVVEGEKDADRLNAEHITATCNLGGAGRNKWLKDYSDTLAGSFVAVVPDNDDPGRAHAVEVVRSLLAHGCEVVVLDLPEAFEGKPVKDVSDFFDAGGTSDGFVDLLATAVPGDAWLEGQVVGPDGELPEFECTELGNARRLLHHFGKDIRFCTGKGFVVWDGTRWRLDDREYIRELAKAAIGRIGDEASRYPEGSDKRKEIEAWAKKSQSRKNIDNMIYLAQTEVTVDPSEFDREPLLLNVTNGTLDLQTGNLRPHRREDMITRMAPVKFRPDQASERWEKLVAWAMSDDPQMVDFFQRALGYGLTGLTKEQAFFICWGTGANGKSTLLDAVVSILGDYATVMDPETLMVKRGDNGIPNDIARLDGVRFVVTSESEIGKRLEAFYEHLQVHHAPPPVEAVATAFVDRWAVEVRDPLPLRFDDGQDADGVKDQGVALLEAFCRQGFIPDEVLAVEQPFAVELVDPATAEVCDIPLIGAIDLVARHQGRVWLIEHKTAARRFTPDRIAYDFQPTCYLTAARTLGLDHPAAAFQILLKQKKPAVETTPLNRTDNDEAEMIDTFLQALRGIEAGAFPRNRGWACGDCQFKGRCGG